MTVASPGDDFLAMQKCPVCGVNAVCKGNERTFYWSHNNTPTTANEVSSKVCRYAKFAGKKGCINTSGEYVETLDWGKNAYDFLVDDELNKFRKDDM